MQLDRRRRSLLARTAAAALLLCLPRLAQSQPSLSAEEFLNLSQKLTGKPDLDPDLAAAYLAAFEDLGEGPALAALATEVPGPAEDGPCARSLVSAWFTDIVGGAEGRRLVTFEDALLWPAMRYIKTLTLCGPGFGAWSEVPET